MTNTTIIEKPKNGPDPIFDLVNRPTTNIAILFPVEHHRMAPWILGHVVRKWIRTRMNEMRNHPSIRGVLPTADEMIVAIKVPDDYNTMGNWDLGAFLKYQILLKETKKGGNE